MVRKQKKTHQKSAASVGTMTDDDWPIALLPEGSLNIVDAGGPRFRPIIVHGSTAASEPRAHDVTRDKSPSSLESFWTELTAECYRLQALVTSRNGT